MINLKQSSKSTAINKTPTWVPFGKFPGHPWRTHSFQLRKSPGRSCRTACLKGWNAIIKDWTVLGRFKHSAARCWKYWKSFWAFNMKDPWGWPKLAFGWRDKNESCERYPNWSFFQLMIWQETQTGAELRKMWQQQGYIIHASSQESTKHEEKLLWMPQTAVQDPCKARRHCSRQDPQNETLHQAHSSCRVIREHTEQT